MLTFPLLKYLRKRSKVLFHFSLLKAIFALFSGKRLIWSGTPAEYSNVSLELAFWLVANSSNRCIPKVQARSFKAVVAHAFSPLVLLLLIMC